MWILLSSCFELKCCHSLDVRLVSIFEDNSRIDLAFHSKSRWVEFLLGRDCTIINYTVVVFLWIHHTCHPLFNVFSRQSQVLQSSILRGLELKQIRIVRLHGLLKNTLEVIRRKVLCLQDPLEGIMDDVSDDQGVAKIGSTWSERIWKEWPSHTWERWDDWSAWYHYEWL